MDSQFDSLFKCCVFKFAHVCVCVVVVLVYTQIYLTHCLGGFVWIELVRPSINGLYYDIIHVANDIPVPSLHLSLFHSLFYSILSLIFDFTSFTGAFGLFFSIELHLFLLVLVLIWH